MQAVQNETASGSLVVLDGKHFTNCKYVDCTLVYCGGDYGWINTQFINCKIVVDGAATRTYNLFKHFGMLKEQAASDPLQQPPTSSKLEGH